ncbi:uncharacterized protein LOC116181629 isoform X2 [Photinus pyralis]|nr:uncharacterized protein LOC116181629 isoform X2 [Photinus pyralis]
MKKTKTKSGDPAKKIKRYKYFEQLSFLSNYFYERETKGNIENDVENIDEEENSQNVDAEETYVSSEPNESGPNVSDVLEPNVLDSSENKQSHLTQRSFKTSSRRLPPQQTASAKLMEYLISDKKDKQVTTAPQHHVDAFLAGVAPTLKSFTPYYLHLAKSEIFHTVQKYEMEMIMQQDSYPRPGPNFVNTRLHSEHSSSTSTSRGTTPLPSPVAPFPQHSLQNPNQNEFSSVGDSNATNNPLQSYFHNFPN